MTSRSDDAALSAFWIPRTVHLRYLAYGEYTESCRWSTVSVELEQVEMPSDRSSQTKDPQQE